MSPSSRPLRCAIYLRVSTDEQHPENQVRELRTYAERMGWAIAEEYVEKESGRQGRGTRQALDRMLRDAGRRRFDVLLVWDLSRLTREGIRMALSYLDRLDGYGVRFVDYNDPHLSTLDPAMRELWVSVKAWVARTEAERISARTKAGLERARAEGKKIGRRRHPARRKIRELLEENAELGPSELHQLVTAAGYEVSLSTVKRERRKALSAEVNR